MSEIRQAHWEPADLPREAQARHMLSAKVILHLHRLAGLSEVSLLGLGLSCQLWRAQVVPELDAEGVDLLRRLLQYNPNQRITAAEALLHPWLAGAALELPEQAPAERRSPDRASPLSDETQLQDVPDGK